MASIQIATVKDIHRIQNIAKTTWPVAFKNILGPDQLEYMMELMYNSDELRSQITGTKVIFWLAEFNELISGFMAFEPNLGSKSQIKIHKLYIDPKAQGKGLGRLLLKNLEEYGLSNAFKRLTLNVNKYNHPAINFYTSQGFNKVEEVIIPIGGGYIMDDYVFTKELG